MRLILRFKSCDFIHKRHLYERADNAKILAQLGCGQEYDAQHEEWVEGGVAFLRSKFTRSSRPFANQQGFRCKQLESGEYIIFREGEK